MPVRTGRLVFGRVMAIAALLAAVLLCLVLLLRAVNHGYTVKVLVSDAGQLVKGNEVQVGGVPVGSVEAVKVRQDERLAELDLSLDERFAPLHEGTTATIRNPSLTSIAGRYVALTLGPNDAPEIPDGGEIPNQDTNEIVDLDQVLDALDPRTVAALSQVVHGAADAAKGRGRQLAAAIDALNPAVSRSAVALGEVARDQGALERLVVNGAAVSQTLASRRDAIATGTDAAGQALNAIADQRQQLTSALAEAPPTLRRAIPTLASVRRLLHDADPAVSEARPVARGLSDLLPRLRVVTDRLSGVVPGRRSLARPSLARPAAERLGGVLPELRSVVLSPGPNDDATDFVTSLPRLAGQGVPLLGSLTDTVGKARPVLAELRPYIPDLTGGIVAGFGGSSGGYYDANGEYARISFVGGPFSTVGLPRGFPGFGSIKPGAAERCPGGANYPVPDGSNPFVDSGVVCQPSLAGSTP